jgi:rhodanese-related sulfurtransferase
MIKGVLSEERTQMSSTSITPTELHELLKSETPLRLVDVREPAEFISELGHIGGSELVPLGTLGPALTRFAGEDRTIISICRSGMRAQKAAALLAEQGCKVRVLTGGMMAWNEAKLPISKESPK